MKIVTNRKMAEADKVLAAFKKMAVANKIEGIVISVDLYSNGREQGYSLYIQDINKGIKNLYSICFSEYRRSDEIVIYVNEEIPPNIGITDKAYENAKFVGYRKYKEAAEYIYFAIVEAIKI